MAATDVRRDDVIDILHGHEVADPYRWLEAPVTDPDVRAFVDAQNAASHDHLARLPGREPFRQRLRELWDHPRLGAPWRRGDRWFQLRNDGLQDQDVLWSAPAAPEQRRQLPGDDDWSVLLDPNTWSEDGTISLAALAATDDGALVAFARSEAGSDWMTWRVIRTATKQVLADEVPWAKFASAAWLPDGSGFIYGAYPAPEPGHEHDAAMRDHRLLLHRLGTDAEDDDLIHARPDQPEWGFSPDVTHDGRWLVIHVSRGTDPTNRVHVAPLRHHDDGSVTVGEVVPLLDDADARYLALGSRGDELLVETDREAPLGRVIAVPFDDPGAAREMVGEDDDRLQSVHLVGGHDEGDPGWIVCHRLHHATARVRVHDLDTGAASHELALPGAGSVESLTGGRRDDVVFLTFATFVAPPVVLRHRLADHHKGAEVGDHLGTDDQLQGDQGDGARRDPAQPQHTGHDPAQPQSDQRDDDERGAVEVVARPELPANSPSVTVEQVRVHHDDVAVPLFVVHRDDVSPDGARPTVLWSYGGFDIPVTPRYLAAWRAWVDAGGVLAVACLRGGGEYGRAWHDDGRRRNKQHVFDDALACAAWLTGQRDGEVHATALSAGAEVGTPWSAPAHLGIEGRSNGGLTVGACLTQRPEAFGSAVPEVGVLDLVRFHCFTIGWAWTSDFGSPDDPDDLEVLLRYSPYHRIADGVAYPSTLLTTGDTDDRVVPAHSFKFAAALQAAQGGPAPVLLRIDTSAGHGAGKPVGKLIDERADVLAFHAHHLGLQVDP